MKKIIILTLLFITSISFAQDDYAKIFNNFDSIQKKSIYSYTNRIISLIKYEYTKKYKNDSDSLSVEKINIAFKTDANGRLNIVNSQENNDSIVFNFINSIVEKTPAINSVTKDKNVVNSQYVTINFSLRKNHNLKKLQERIYGKNDIESPKDLKTLVIYPSFKNNETTSSQENTSANFNRKINSHIQKNFNYPEAAKENDIQGRIYIYFIIEKDGFIEEINVRGGHPILHQEGVRIIKLLPQFTPGESENGPVRVSYLLPLNFKLG